MKIVMPLLCILITLPSYSGESNLVDAMEKLQDLTCGKIINTGSDETIVIDGNAQAKVSGIAKIFASAKGGAAGAKVVSTYKGVNRNDLLKDKNKVISCRQIVYSDISPLIISSLVEKAKKPPTKPTPLLSECFKVMSAVKHVTWQGVNPNSPAHKGNASFSFEAGASGHQNKEIKFHGNMASGGSSYALEGKIINGKFDFDTPLFPRRGKTAKLTGKGSCSGGKAIGKFSYVGHGPAYEYVVTFY